MNAGIAELLRARISTFAYVDKLAGLVRPITYQRTDGSGKMVNITIPVGIDVVDPLSCDETTQLELVPNEAYSTIVYFEDRGTTVNQRQGLTLRVSHVRLVCWINTAKLNGENLAADKIMADFDAVMSGTPYNSVEFVGIRHRVEGYPTKGPGLFSQYTYPEGIRQYLMWPFDAFAIDIATEFQPNPACTIPVVVDDVACWTPPTAGNAPSPTPACPVVRSCDTPEEGNVLTRVGGANVWQAPAGGGAGGGTNTVEVATGAINGSNATFTSSVDFVIGSLEVYVNGLLQRKPTDYNTTGTNTVIFSDSPQAGDAVTLSFTQL